MSSNRPSELWIKIIFMPLIKTPIEPFITLHFPTHKTYFGVLDDIWLQNMIGMIAMNTEYEIYKKQVCGI